MTTARYTELLAAEMPPELFVRRALSFLQADFRDLALAALSDWERLGLPAPELFGTVASLQRPSWGTWNALLLGLQASARKVQEGGGAELRDALARSANLSRVLALLDQPLDPEAVQGMRPLAQLTRCGAGKRPKIGDLLALPVALRNITAHDTPVEASWWDAAAAALKPVVEFHARWDPGLGIVPPPWVLVEGEESWAFNGFTSGFSASYLSRSGVARALPERGPELLGAFQRLLGKAGVPADEFARLLGKLAPGAAQQELKVIVQKALEQKGPPLAIVVVTDEKGNLLIRHPVTESVVTLGRDQTNTIQLADGSVSGRHAEIKLDGLFVQLKDLGSRNGTFVGDGKKRVTSSLLSFGDPVRIGPYALVLRSPTDADGGAEQIPRTVPR